MSDGELVRELNADDTRAFKGPRGAQPRVGSNVRLWRLDGYWSVWSDGPKSGTWWLVAQDSEAHVVAGLALDRPETAQPVVVAAAPNAIAVKSKEIRPQGLAS